MAKRIQRSSARPTTPKARSSAPAQGRKGGGRVKGSLVTDFTVQLATLSEVLEHLPSTAVPPLLAEIHRLLRPGGRLILTTPNLLALPYRLLLLIGRSPFELPVQTSFAPGTYGHIRLWSADEVAALGRQAGFEIEKVCHRTWMLGHYCFDRATQHWAEKLLLLLDRTLGALRPRCRDSWAMVLRRP